MALADAMQALLHVASNSLPFSDTAVNEPVYSSVSFTWGYPNEDAQAYTVALVPNGGRFRRLELGSVAQERKPNITVLILTPYVIEARRICQKLREVWIADMDWTAFDYTGTLSFGDVGAGYLRETGLIKDLTFTEATGAPWENLKRLQFNVSPRIRD